MSHLLLNTQTVSMVVEIQTAWRNWLTHLDRYSQSHGSHGHGSQFGCYLLSSLRPLASHLTMSALNTKLEKVGLT